MTSPLDKADPYKMMPFGSFGLGLSSASGRVQVDPRITGGQKTGVIVTHGQSLICNSVRDSIGNVYQTDTPASPLVHNLNIIDGGVYRAKDALLGCHGSGRNVATKLADLLIANAKYDRVILVPIGFSASASGDWRAGGNLNHRIGVAVRRLAVLGYTPDFIIWQQGSADAAVAVTRAQYTANLQSVIATWRDMGVTCPIMVSQESWISSALPSDANIRGAQTDVLNASAKIYAGGDSDSLPGSRRFDDIHFNYTGRDEMAALHYATIAPLVP